MSEDTKPPEASITLINDNNEAFSSPSLIAGDYKVQIEFDEYLDVSPMLNITTIGGGDILGGEKEMAMIQENAGNRTEVQFTNSISSSLPLRHQVRSNLKSVWRTLPTTKQHNLGLIEQLMQFPLKSSFIRLHQVRMPIQSICMETRFNSSQSL